MGKYEKKPVESDDCVEKNENKNEEDRKNKKRHYWAKSWGK